MLKSATRASADCELPTFECHLQNTPCADDAAPPIENLFIWPPEKWSRKRAQLS